ncbi:MAG: hypothetical protein M3Q99_14965 [Acidobacteriota bacterium]|nr:hypothetical protein [Acidobacteriota bacterium]
MEKDKFRSNFNLAIQTLVPFARSYLIDSLPLELRYLMFFNQSFDGNELVGDENLFPEDSLPKNRVQEFENQEQVINCLWRNGKIPEWINLFIHSYDENFTFISLICCGRFTADDKLLYHEKEGCQPFHILGPNLPIGFENLETSGKFNLAWHGRPSNKNEPY